MHPKSHGKRVVQWSRESVEGMPCGTRAALLDAGVLVLVLSLSVSVGVTGTDNRRT